MITDITIDSILSELEEYVRQEQPITPSLWLDKALQLNVLIGKEHRRLFELQQKVAKIKLSFIESQEKINVSEAKLRVESTDEYRQYHEQKAKIDQVIEYIRICKVQARIRMDEWRGN